MRYLHAQKAGRRGVTTLEQFSRLVADIYDAALDPAQWDQTLRHVCSVTGGNNSALVLYDREKRRRPHIIAANLGAEPSGSDRHSSLGHTGEPALRRVLQRLGAP